NCVAHAFPETLRARISFALLGFSLLFCPGPFGLGFGFGVAQSLADGLICGLNFVVDLLVSLGSFLAGLRRVVLCDLAVLFTPARSLALDFGLRLLLQSLLADLRRLVLFRNPFLSILARLVRRSLMLDLLFLVLRQLQVGLGVDGGRLALIKLG